MSLAIDGTVTGTTFAGNKSSVTLSNSLTNDLICVLTYANGTIPRIAGISDTAGLTWTQRYVSPVVGTGQKIEFWYAPSAGILTSDVITVDWTGSTANSGRVTAFGINGADLVTPFDTNASLPAATTGSLVTTISRTISTDQADTMLIAFLQAGGNASMGAETLPSGFAQVIGTGLGEDIAYSVVSAAQSSVAETYSWVNSVNCGYVVDAVRAASGSSPSVSLTAVAATGAVAGAGIEIDYALGAVAATGAVAAVAVEGDANPSLAAVAATGAAVAAIGNPAAPANGVAASGAVESVAIEIDVPLGIVATTGRAAAVGIPGVVTGNQNLPALGVGS